MMRFQKEMNFCGPHDNRLGALAIMSAYDEKRTVVSSTFRSPAVGRTSLICSRQAKPMFVTGVLGSGRHSIKSDCSSLKGCLQNVLHSSLNFSIVFHVA